MNPCYVILYSAKKPVTNGDFITKKFHEIALLNANGIITSEFSTVLIAVKLLIGNFT
jgi:hypothetical protein